MATARPRCGAIKPGSRAEFNLQYAPKYKPRPIVKPRPCPYRGLMAAGWRAYFAGKPRPYPGTPAYGKSWAYLQGWRKAKLAHEQGKPAI